MRLSLRTGEPTEVKRRQREVDAYFDAIFASLRQKTPATITHKQAVALAGEVYRMWIDGTGERTTAIELTADRRWVPATLSQAEEARGWNIAAASFAGQLADCEDGEVSQP